MVSKMFAIYDLKAKNFWPPYCSVTPGVGIREFATMVKSPQTGLSKFPEDYVLYQIGTYDDAQGVVTSEVHVLLAKATEFVDTWIGAKPAVSEDTIRSMGIDPMKIRG